MTNWQIIVTTPTGAPKVIYNNVNPGGIVSTISVDVEPSGNCLSGSFDGIPAQLNIGPRDLVQIVVGSQPRFFGYVSAMPNALSKEVGTYQLEGIKKLYYERMLDQFWYQPTSSGNYVNGLLRHDAIVQVLHQYRPSFVSAVQLNGASSTTGNRAPIVAQDFSLGDILDAIINSAADGEIYHWGINRSKQFFVNKESDFAPIDFTDTDKIVTATQQNVDDVVTSVRFVFTVPEGYYHPKLATKTHTVNGTTANPKIENFNDYAPIGYEYTDTSAASTYGKWTKTVPLVLSDTWMKLVSLTEAAAMSGTVDVTLNTDWPNLWSYMKTQSGATSQSALLTSLSTPGTGTYITTTGDLASTNRGFEIDLHSGSVDYSTNPTSLLNLKGLIGFYFRAGVLSSDRPITWESKRIFAKSASSTTRPFYDYNWYFPSAEDEANTWEDVKVYTILPSRSLPEWTVDPNETNVVGFKNGDVRAVQSKIMISSSVPGITYTGVVPAGDFRVYEWFCLFLNTESLDAYAKTLIQTPEDFPSEIEVKTDLGLGFSALLEDEIETKVVRINYEVSVDRGLVVTYTTGRDEQRSNAFLTRLMARESSARNNAVLVSGARL